MARVQEEEEIPTWEGMVLQQKQNSFETVCKTAQLGYICKYKFWIKNPPTFWEGYII